jgi:hypothetical protein
MQGRQKIGGLMQEFDHTCDELKAQCRAKPQEDRLPDEGPIAQGEDEEEDQYGLERDI